MAVLDLQLSFVRSSIKLDILSVLHHATLAAGSHRCVAFTSKDRGDIWLLSTLPDNYDDD